jgi:hypothetical protein
MGFLLPAMTQEKLDNQRDVVKNERRQSYENRPYGLVHETLLGALYPAGHPYSLADDRLDGGPHGARRSRTWRASSAAGTARTTPRWRSAATFESAARARARRALVRRAPDRPAGRAARAEPADCSRRSACARGPRAAAAAHAVLADGRDGAPDEAALDFLADVLSANRRRCSTARS